MSDILVLVLTRFLLTSRGAGQQLLSEHLDKCLLEMLCSGLATKRVSEADLLGMIVH